MARCGCAIRFDTDRQFHELLTAGKSGTLQIEYCPLHAAAPDLLEACRIVKRFLVNLELGTDPMDVAMRAIRERIHQPLHAALDPAIGKALTERPHSAETQTGKGGRQ